MNGSINSRDHPRVALITGAPGSGKTTLGIELSRALRVPFFARDDVRGGLFMTAGAWSQQPRGVPSVENAVEAFLRMIETTARLGVSCVAEYVIRKERPEDLRRMVSAADCVVLQVSCENAMTRLVRRNSVDRLLNQQPVLDLLGFASIDDHTTHAVQRAESLIQQMQVEFELPSLNVRTDDGYEPGLDRIASFVIDGR